MKKITLLMAALVVVSTFASAATGWFSDFLSVNINGAGVTSYWIGSVPASGVAWQGAALGTVSSLEFAGVDMNYWSDTHDRTGGAVYYKISNSTNTVDIVPATEILWDQAATGDNNFQGTKTISADLLAGVPFGSACQLHIWAKSWGPGQGDDWLTNNGSNYVATFTKANPTTFTGTYKVGTTALADFSSLSAAVAVINAGTITGDVTLEITSDLTEANNIGLGVNTAGFTLTIKPQAGIAPTLTFTGTAAQSIDGNFVIGSPTVANTNLVPTNNVVIDGSNTVNGTTKDMTINGAVTSNQISVIRIFGNNDNIIIKNCIITNRSTSANSTAPITVTDYYSGSNFTPDILTITNNTLSSLAGNGGLGVYLSNSGSPTVGMTGIVVSNNIISHRGTRAIMCNYVNDANIFGNQISAAIQSGNAAGAGIFLSTGTASAGTFNIYNNRFSNLSILNTAIGTGNGYIAIDNGLASPKIVNIYNNFITGFTITAAVSNSKIYGIRHTGASVSNVYNNTIVLPEMTNMTALGSTFIAGIAFATAATTEAAPTGSMNIKNNIIVSNETGMKTWGIRRIGTGGTFKSNNNIIYNSNTTNGCVGFFNTSDARDIAAWQTASSQDADSKSVAVSFADVVAGDLSIAGLSIRDADLKVPGLATILNDIFGTVRNVEFTYAGAHESTLPFLSTYVENRVEQTARIMRTSSGVEISLDGEVMVELYTINGLLIEKTNASGTYSRDLNSGVYIIRINGKATKFVK